MGVWSSGVGSLFSRLSMDKWYISVKALMKTLLRNTNGNNRPRR